MAPQSGTVAKLKVQLKLAISRLRMIQQKETAIAKQQRRAMAQLLEQGKIESARIRVENIIRSDLTTELHEILELYCELLLARIGLLDPNSPSSQPPTSSSGAALSPKEAQAYCDPGLEEAVHSLIHASPRTDVKELHTCRSLLIERFGKDFSIRATEDSENKVAERVKKRLDTSPPKSDLVDAYLEEIARTYGVAWPEKSNQDDDTNTDLGGDDDDPEGKFGGQKEPTEAAQRKESKQLEKPLEAEELSRATPPRDLGPKSPSVRVAPPSPSTENVTPKLRMPGQGDAKTGSAARVNGKVEQKSKKDDGGGPGGKIPDVDELAKRFAELKR
ncbi:MAG: hypothetical protein M1820_001499 [Bogoriella megaspora]|nr:MAG: hypothetical protein M1820_001499 [Bogoriella megaspora]